ncbi:MAG TPA: hypothetical protein VFL83_13055 [Anaeromyxobacter sp.]|nr:hypothetical protein [Anaeromyxobacter sp.]
MAHVARSVDIGAPAEALHEQWLRWEALPRCAAGSVAAGIRWRAEVLTFQPIPGGTRVTLKVEYDEAGGDPGIAGRLERVLRGFAAFAGATVASPA